MEKAYKFRIYPNDAQERLIQCTFGCCRFVYNRFLAMRIAAFSTEKKAYNYNDCSADMTILKKEFAWLQEVDALALLSALKDLDFAFQGFYRRDKRGEKPGFPRYKRKHDNRKSFRSKNVGSCIAIQNNYVRLPKLGLVRCAVSKQVEGRILSATISQNPSGKYFVSLCCTEETIPQFVRTGAVVGLDLGLTDFAVSSDGYSYKNHKYLGQSEKRLKKYQRQLSRKQKGGSNYNKARIKLAKLHEHIANQRNDTMHKFTTQLVKDYDMIAIETLRPMNMLKNKELAKSISDASWGAFVCQLEYKARWQHKTLVKVSPFFPSSQICSVCGAQNPKIKDLRIRKWRCAACGTEHDRDLNAAKNILSEGIRLSA